MIEQPAEMKFSGNPLFVILFGFPGVGKTTLASSKSDSIVVDCDNGVGRVPARYRRPRIVCKSYEELLSDMESPVVAAADTIIIDTGGSFVTLLQDFVMRQNPAQNRQRTGALSLKGFGAVKTEFVRFINRLKTVNRKNVVIIFHADEKADKDGNPQLRILCEGAVKNIVWTYADCGGYIHMEGDNRVITFQPGETFFAKACHGIKPQYVIPELGASDKNNFMDMLFDEIRGNIQAEEDANAEIIKEYEHTIAEGTAIIDGIMGEDDVPTALEALKSFKVVLTSKQELNHYFKSRMSALGLVWDKTAKTYTAPKKGDAG